MGRSTKEEIGLSEQRKYRSWTAQQKLEIVLAGLRGDRSVREVCREQAISETLYYGWRDQLLEASRVYDNEVYDRAIDIQILRLRRKIEVDPAQPKFIVTERGAGYIFNCPVEVVY